MMLFNDYCIFFFFCCFYYLFFKIICVIVIVFVCVIEINILLLWGEFVMYGVFVFLVSILIFCKLILLIFVFYVLENVFL